MVPNSEKKCQKMIVTFEMVRVAKEEVTTTSVMVYQPHFGYYQSGPQFLSAASRL